MGVELDHAEEVVELGADVRRNLGVSHGGQRWRRVRKSLIRRLVEGLAEAVRREGLAAMAGGAGMVCVGVLAARVGGGVGGAGSEDRDTR